MMAAAWWPPVPDVCACQLKLSRVVSAVSFPCKFSWVFTVVAQGDPGATPCRTENPPRHPSRR